MSDSRNQYVSILSSEQKPEPLEQAEQKAPSTVSEEKKEEAVVHNIESVSGILKCFLAELEALEQQQIAEMKAHEGTASWYRWYAASGSFLIVAGLAWGICAPFIGSDTGYLQDNMRYADRDRDCDDYGHGTAVHLHRDSCDYGYGNNPGMYAAGWIPGAVLIAGGIALIKYANSLRNDPQGLEEKVSFGTYAKLARIGLLQKRQDEQAFCGSDVGTVTRRKFMSEIAESKSQLNARIDQQAQIEAAEKATQQMDETPPDYQQSVQSDSAEPSVLEVKRSGTPELDDLIELVTIPPSNNTLTSNDEQSTQQIIFSSPAESLAIEIAEPPQIIFFSTDSLGDEVEPGAPVEGAEQEATDDIEQAVEGRSYRR